MHIYTSTEVKGKCFLTCLVAFYKIFWISSRWPYDKLFTVLRRTRQLFEFKNTAFSLLFCIDYKSFLVQGTFYLISLYGGCLLQLGKIPFPISPSNHPIIIMENIVSVGSQSWLSSSNVDVYSLGFCHLTCTEQTL